MRLCYLSFNIFICESDVSLASASFGVHGHLMVKETNFLVHRFRGADGIAKTIQYIKKDKQMNARKD